MIELVGKEVIVETVMGISYKGKLVEIGETDVHLEAETGWMVIPMENIVSIGLNE